MFIDVSKALSWAYMMRTKDIIDRPSMAGMYGSSRSSSNDVLVGLNAQEAIQQSADIIFIVESINDKSCAQYLKAKYGRDFSGINELVDRVASRMGFSVTYRSGIQYIIAKYCGVRVTKEQIRSSLRCDNNNVEDIQGKVYSILDDVHGRAIVEIENKLVERGLV